MHQERTADFDQFSDAQALAAAAAKEILAASRDAVAERGRFRIVLAGGMTPLAVYRLLAGEAVDWGAWEVYFGDERCLPPEHPGRNSQAARDALIDRVPIPAGQVFAIPAELGSEPAADAYARIVAAARPFDLVLLGMGEDGHTASLFPGHHIPRGVLAMAVHGAPKPPPERVSLTPVALRDCRRMLVLVTGAGKQAALAAWRHGANLPVAKVAAACNARVLVDADAAGKWEKGA
jgi:6-phosphogluconolactonase